MTAPWAAIICTLIFSLAMVISVGIWADTRMKEAKFHYDLMKKPKVEGRPIPGTGEKPT